MNRRWLAAMLVATSIPAQAEELPPGVDPVTGFRMENYRAPTPGVLPGGVVADYALAEQASRGQGYKLVDVYVSGAVSDPITGEWTNMEKRQQIPGSVWLPGVGSGALDRDQEEFFRRNLNKLSGGDKDAGLMFYCQSDCWQSWNAARRAVLWGYTKVAWYPLGTDGWKENGGRLVGVKAENFIDEGM